MRQIRSNAYVAVIGVAIGMLIAGLGVPMAFGRFQSESDTVAQSPGQQSGTSFGSAPLPGASAGPGVVSGPAGGPLAGPVATAGPGAVSGPGSLPGGGPATGGGQVRLRATDQGVTATTVKLGVVLLDIRALEPVGFAQPHFTPQEQQAQYQHFIDEVNRSGGLNGRRIVPDYKTYNALDTNGAQSGPAICVQLAEDDKVFAAIGVLGGGMDACLTEQYGIPSISNTSQIDEVYRKSHNLMVSAFASFDRGAATWADLAARSGLVDGHKTGTVFMDIPTEKVPETAFFNAFKAAGHTVTYRAKLASDPATAQSQLPVEIQKMQAAGVDTVFLVTNFIMAIQFAQTAEQQGYRPRYWVSDLGSLTAEGLVTSMPRSYNGTLAYTQGQPPPESAWNKRCRVSWNKATGNHYAAGNESGGLTLFCWMVTVFSDGARAAGPTLTRNGWANAIQHLQLSIGLVLPGSFRVGKTDYADYLRPERYATSCKCYHDAGAAQKGRY